RLRPGPALLGPVAGRSASGRQPGSLGRMSLRFVIIGGGPAGTQAATYAARLGAEVTLIERDVVGGAAHLWDCIPSKSMIATGGTLDSFEAAAGMGVDATSASVDLPALRARITEVVSRLEDSSRQLLESQSVH